jgi:hypothetical protein
MGSVVMNWHKARALRPACGLWHELCDAGGTLWAHGAGIEAALLPDHASEKFHGEAILCRSLFQRPANVVGRGRIRSRALRFGWHGLLIDLWRPADGPAART